MFGARKRREAASAAVAEKMDEEEALSWRWRQRAEEIGDDAARGELDAERGARGVADIIEDLLATCRTAPGDPVELLMHTLDRWHESRNQAAEDEDRAGHVSGMYMSIALTGVGNLFGFVPDAAPTADPGLAAEGRRRGWRQ